MHMSSSFARLVTCLALWTAADAVAAQQPPACPKPPAGFEVGGEGTFPVHGAPGSGQFRTGRQCEFVRWGGEQPLRAQWIVAPESLADALAATRRAAEREKARELESREVPAGPAAGAPRLQRVTLRLADGATRRLWMTTRGPWLYTLQEEYRAVAEEERLAPLRAALFAALPAP
jgi:hypothetical protein